MYRASQVGMSLHFQNKQNQHTNKERGDYTVTLPVEPLKNCIPRYNTSITSQNMHQLKVRHTKHSRTFNDTRRGLGAFSYFNNISTYEGNNDKGKLKLEQLSDLISLQLITFSILTMTSKQQQPASRFINTSRQFGGNKTLRTFNFVICELSGMQCDQI